MKIYIERQEDAFVTQAENFLNKLSKAPYLTLFSVDATELSNAQKDLALFKWCTSSVKTVDTYVSGLVEFKNNLRSGENLGALPPLPPLPALPTAPPVTSASMEKRLRKLIQKLVDSPNMTEAIAKDLGIIAPETAGRVDVSTLSPEFKLSISSGGYPLIAWKKAGFAGVEIHKSKDGVSFSKLDRDYKPDYIDKSDLPEGKGEVWHYKLIYLSNETDHIGQWSGIQSIAVGG